MTPMRWRVNGVLSGTGGPIAVDLTAPGLAQAVEHRSGLESFALGEGEGPAEEARAGVPLAFFATDHGPRDATRSSRVHLVETLIGAFGKPGRSVRKLLGDDATADGFRALLRGTAEGLAGPRLLFSA